MSARRHARREYGLCQDCACPSLVCSVSTGDHGGGAIQRGVRGGERDADGHGLRPDGWHGDGASGAWRVRHGELGERDVCVVHRYARRRFDGHNMIVANQKNALYEKLFAAGIPVMDFLAEVMLSDKY